MADLLKVTGAIDLGGFEELFGDFLDELFEDKDADDLAAGGADDDQGPEAVDHWLT